MAVELLAYPGQHKTPHSSYRGEVAGQGVLQEVYQQSSSSFQDSGGLNEHANRISHAKYLVLLVVLYSIQCALNG